MRTKLLLLLLFVVLGVGADGGERWWRDWRFQQSTDDAYVASDISLISPKIEGYIKQVGVEDNQHVSAGQMLFVIDDSDFAAKVAQAQAAVDAENGGAAAVDQHHEHPFVLVH